MLSGSDILSITNQTNTTEETQMKQAIACIRSNDDVNGNLIAFFMDTETFELTNDSGESDGYFDFNPTCEEEAIYFIRQQWGTWNTFNWIEQE